METVNKVKVTNQAAMNSLTSNKVIAKAEHEIDSQLAVKVVDKGIVWH